MSRGRIIRWMLEEVGAPDGRAQRISEARSAGLSRDQSDGQGPGDRPRRTVVTDAPRSAPIWPTPSPTPGSRLRRPTAPPTIAGSFRRRAGRSVTASSRDLENEPRAAGIGGFCNTALALDAMEGAVSEGPTISPASPSAPPTSMSAPTSAGACSSGARSSGRPVFRGLCCPPRLSGPPTSGPPRSTMMQPRRCPKASVLREGSAVARHLPRQAASIAAFTAATAFAVFMASGPPAPSPREKTAARLP